MGRNSSGVNLFLEYYAIFLTICMISCVPVLVGEDLYTFVIRFGILLFFIKVFLNIRKDVNLVGLVYCGAITIGFVFHRLQGLDAKLFGELLIRIVPVLIILHYKHDTHSKNKVIRLFALSFFVLECVLAIYEKMTLTHLIIIPTLRL